MTKVFILSSKKLSSGRYDCRLFDILLFGWLLFWKTVLISVGDMMSQEEILEMEIRAMLYKYQSELLSVTDSDGEFKQILHSIIDDLVELSSIVSNLRNRYR